MPIASEVRVQRLTAWEKQLDRLLETIVTLMFVGILGLTILLVVMRYGFNSSIIGGNEAMEYLFIYTTALGAAVSVGKGTHIRIAFVVDNLKGVPKRCVDTLGYLLIAFINAVMIYYSVPWIRSAGYFESPVMRIPNWMVQVSVPLGCGLVILYCLNHVFIEWFGLSEKSANDT
jgi:TRAP-type C4-dicarboxylate transport system permease small subunit